MSPVLFRHRRLILLVAALLTLALAVVAAGAMTTLVLSRWEAPGSESVQVQELLERDHHTGNANLVLLVSGVIDDPAVAAAADDVATGLRGEEAVADVWSYWSRRGDPTMRSADGRHALILAHVTGDATSARLHIRERILPAYTRDTGLIRVAVGGAEAVAGQVSQQATRDFVRAEVLILPVMVVLLFILYRRFRLALLTLGVGLFAVVGTLAGLRVLAGFTEVATFAANITLVMGIGLGIDYSLFVIARFREELAAGAPVPAAVGTTIRTAGRTVVFSGLTVAASLSALLLFPFAFLRSFAYAGILVVVLAVVGALTILPAALAVLGPRAQRRTRPSPRETGFWFRIGSRVMRRPVLFTALGLLVVGVLAAPHSACAWVCPTTGSCPRPQPPAKPTTSCARSCPRSRRTPCTSSSGGQSPCLPAPPPTPGPPTSHLPTLHSPPPHPVALQAAPPHPMALQAAPPHPMALQAAPPHPMALQAAPPHPVALQAAPSHPVTRRVAA
ncbi:MMPL family transporter [Actinoplanes sp. CA-252034]|uniref:MMPL family transporter n=1 Tax=Actinoplanes sp. CA-252034 TaxID=3239906 RepID=UPI003D977A07